MEWVYAIGSGVLCGLIGGILGAYLYECFFYRHKD